ncbi:aminotransferase class I/II-fold pyridoxal phosphate-dependent enzyme [Pectinatus haikarae]|uniref:Lysine decarboxylase n=1 Tax=Pectinatus haikarae TaxID=349096 RepID=A0ABT9YC31_9FIRM|nr:aminotransferase class I/II-fold pyridoxal phosphate-dependent enzyme [Pectinatus haikarae]MDQ0204777.1 lysine decarboxylase [Pectinatus haikarae]
MMQEDAPLFAAMQKYVNDKAVAFHTPGHKQGKGANEILKKIVTPMGLKMDVSLMEELDDLFAPETCIKQAQDLAAKLYEADESLFMVNGTTGAIHIMLFSALAPGDKIIIPRNVHKSVLGAIILCGAEPIFIEPAINTDLGIAMAVQTECVEKAIAANKDAKAVFLVYPTYYGVACDIREIAEIVHKNGMLLLVDEAHGPHLKFSEKLPVQAMDAGADMAAQSTHKILASLTQTSMLHIKYKRVDIERVHMANSLLQSTSPNYLLLASLDAARRQMAQKGKMLIDNAVRLAEKLRERINTIAGLYCFGTEVAGSEGCFSIDRTKITVTVKKLGITGYEAEKILRHKYKIQCELADMYNVLFIISLADSERETEILYSALAELADDHSGKIKEAVADEVDIPLPIVRMTPRRAMFAAHENIDFIMSENRICGETITFYPPGIPLIYPGEIISDKLIEYIKKRQQAGAKIVGPADTKLHTIRVIR